MTYTQRKFDCALAQAEERAKRTDLDQHIIATDMGDFVVIDEGQTEMPQWLIDQIIFSVTDKLCTGYDADEQFWRSIDAAQTAQDWNRKMDTDWLNEADLPY